jgi:RimJ/RimL family protein N-acetyltransferase
VAAQPRQESPRPPVPCIVGERLVLGPLDRDLLPTYLRWNNDFAMTRTLAASRPQTLDALEADYRHLADDQSSVSFTIYERGTGRPIGNAAWTTIDRRNRTAEYVIFIGEADCRGKGYGTEATRLMLDYAFADLGLHNVMLRVYAYNLAGYHAYRKVGFREYGRRRQCKFMGGRLWDVIYMECVAGD